MDASQRAQWEQTRTGGFWRFVLPLAFGFCGAMNVGMSVFDYFTSPPELEGVRRQYLVKALIWLITGFIAGLTGWFYAENKYKKSFGGDS